MKKLIGLLLAVAVSATIIDAQQTQDKAKPEVAPVKDEPGVRLLQGHTGPVHDLRFTPDGRKLISCSGWPGNDNSIRIWDLASGQELHRINTPGQVSSIELDRAGRFALAGSYQTIFKVDVETGQAVRAVKGVDTMIMSVTLARDGKHAYSAGQDGFVRRWDLETGEEVNRYRVLGKWARYAAEIAEGRLVTADIGRQIQIWDVANGTQLKHITTKDGWLSSALLVPGGGQLLLGGWGATLWDLNSGEQVRSFDGHKNEVPHMEVAPDGKRLLTAAFDGSVRLWDLASGALLQVVSTQDEFVYVATFSPDGRWIATGGGGRHEGGKFLPGNDHAIRLIDMTAESAAPVVEATPVPPARSRRWLGLLALLVGGLIAASVVALLLVRRRAADG